MHFRLENKLYQAFICAVVVLCSIWNTACGKSMFEIKRVGNIHSYESNAFRVYAEEDGYLTISIHDEICVYRELAEKINAGETTIEWDGCAYNKEKLYDKSYTITAVFVTDTGKTYTSSFQSPVEYPGQCLQYALPSSKTLYLDSAESWFIEYRTVKDGTVIMTLTQEGQELPSFSYKISATGGKISRNDFDTISRGKRPETGRYILKIYEMSKPEESYEYPLSVSGTKPDAVSISVTGEIMPDRDMTEEEIWAKMMEPSVVVDIDYFKHQDVYEKPDSHSKSLGTLHGQTQGLKVIGIDDTWAYIGAWNHEEGEYVEGWVPLQKLKTEKPSDEYGLLIDKQKQTMSVFYHGKIIDTLFVSTGRAERNSLYQETSAGCFLTGYHRVNFSTNGKKYDYVIQYDGGNLLHQTPYEWGKNKKDFSLGRGYLGAKASHACIRIQPDPGAGGLNAYWLFTHLPYHTRVIILDDPDERKAEHSRLKRNDNSQLLQKMAVAQDGKDDLSDNSVSITFCGKIVPGGSRIFNARKESFVSFAEKEGYHKPFSELMQLLSEDDLTCADLGGALEGNSGIAPENKNLLYGPKGINEVFMDASIELITITDDLLYQREDIFKNTREEASGFSEVMDRFQPVAYTLKGHNIGFAGCSESEYLSDVNVISERISQLKEMNCEKIVFTVSVKESKDQNHSIVQEAIANRCVLAGADFVIFNQYGAAKGIEYIRGVPVIYNTGTILDGSTSRKTKVHYSMLVRVQFVFSQDDDKTEVTVIPVLPYGNSQAEKNTYCPELLNTPNDTDLFIRQIWNDSSDESIGRTFIRIAGQS